MQQFTRVKLTVIFYLAAWKMITATHSKAELVEKILCWLIINKPFPNLYSRGTSIKAGGHFPLSWKCSLNYRGSTVVMFQYASTTNEHLFVL